MSIESLKQQLPEYAKDLKLNLSSLAAETVLSEQQKAGAFVASALAARNSAVSEALIAEFAPKLSPEALTAAKAAAAIMAMNNIYYRFTHLASSPDYKTLPAKLRMNAIAKPGVEGAKYCCSPPPRFRSAGRRPCGSRRSREPIRPFGTPS